MNNKIVKAVSALVFLGFSVVLALMMIQSIKEGVVTTGQKGYLAMFGLLLVYALWRVFCLVRDIFKR